MDIFLEAISNVNLARIKNIDTLPKLKRIVATWNQKVSPEEEGSLFVGHVSSRSIKPLGEVVFDPEYKIPLMPVFSHDEMNKEIMGDGDKLYILPKESLLLLIRTYQKHVAKGFREIVEVGKKNIDDPLRDGVETPLAFLERKADEWESVLDLIVNTDLNRPESIVSSLEYEYAIFDLVRIYKTFDFKNETLLVVSH